jgi:hypothetical protein
MRYTGPVAEDRSGRLAALHGDVSAGGVVSFLTDLSREMINPLVAAAPSVLGAMQGPAGAARRGRACAIFHAAVGKAAPPASLLPGVLGATAASASGAGRPPRVE